MVNIVNSINLNVTHALANEDNYFTIKKYTFNNNEYKIIRYNKAKLKELSIVSDYDKYNTISKITGKTKTFSDLVSAQTLWRALADFAKIHHPPR